MESLHFKILAIRPDYLYTLWTKQTKNTCSLDLVHGFQMHVFRGTAKWELWVQEFH